MLLVTSLSLAATLEVGPTAPYSTISAALAAAASGDTISVQPGTYSETPALAGKNVSLLSRDGPWTTTIVADASIVLDSGSFEGFTLSPAFSTAISISSGTPTVREVVIEAPSASGIEVTGGSPLLEEVGVFDAGAYGFRIRGGSATLRRLVSVNAKTYGLQINGAGSVSNLLTIGGAYGIAPNKSGLLLSNVVVLDAQVGLAVYQATTLNNSVVDSSKNVAQCFSSATLGATYTFAPGAFSTADCASSTLDSIQATEPEFERWTSGATLFELDLSPATGSPLVNAGTGTDTDGSAADIGLFGGSGGAWRDRDADGVPVLFDCDDHDAARYWGAVERADGVDDDCNGLIDDDVPVDTGTPPDTGDDTAGETGGDTGEGVLGKDIDGDGYATPLDCGDHNIATYPGAPERLDGADNDCDGIADNGTAGGDDDGDGYSEIAGDCDDTNAARHPGAAETARDGVDDDCDGTDSSPRGQDNDDDGYTDASDCDDTDPLVHPNAADPTNGVDDDCDGITDDDELYADADGDGVTPVEGDCDDSDPTLSPRNYDTPDDYIDQDCTGEDNFDVDRDGHAAPASGGEDCADSLSTVYPGAPENCVDSYDNDCDGEVNEDCDEAGGGDGGDSCGCAAVPAGGAVWLFASVSLLVARRRAK